MFAMQRPSISNISNEDVASIERATVAAVAPQSVQEIPGWLLPMDSGTIGRSKSAAPLRHDVIDDWALAEIERRYRAANLPATFRLPDLPHFKPIKESLRDLGYAAGRPTHVQVAATASVLAVSSQLDAKLADAPDQAWAALFLGEGFDPVDGASRVRSLSRASGTRFASVHADGRVVAAGAGAFSHGWASVHGMRTEPSSRGRGFAARVLASLAQAAMDRGLGRMFLQVEDGNAPAQALYRRAGFQTVWCYDYWSRM